MITGRIINWHVMHREVVMKRIIFIILRRIYIVPFWIYRICILGKGNYDEKTRYTYLHNVTKKVNRAGRVMIECHGTKNLPKENGYIMFPNHQGLFDVLTLLETHEEPFTFVVKKEVKDTILVKQIIRLLRAQVIDREDVRQSMKVIMNMTNEVKEGRNYIIFAEGTRTRDHNNILEFKAGSFKSAMNAKCPIVPVVLIDSYKAFDTSSIAKLTIQIHYLEPLYYDDYKSMNSKEIAKEVENRIRDTIIANEK